MIGKRILLVDDEEALLRLLDRYLSGLGFHVTACPTGTLAISDRGEYDAAVVDLGLPDMEGLDVVEHLLGAHSRIRVLVSSGGAFDPCVLGDRAARVGFLPKPYPPKSLGAALASLLSC